MLSMLCRWGWKKRGEAWKSGWPQDGSTGSPMRRRGSAFSLINRTRHLHHSRSLVPGYFQPDGGSCLTNTRAHTSRKTNALADTLQQRAQSTSDDLLPDVDIHEPLETRAHRSCLLDEGIAVTHRGPWQSPTVRRLSTVTPRKLPEIRHHQDKCRLPMVYVYA
jgi:hypothetical protein